MPKYKDSPEVRAAKKGKEREAERIFAIAGCRGLQ